MTNLAEQLSAAPYPGTNALIPITTRPDVVFTRGQGSWLWDDQGNRYLDFIQGWAVNSLGHCPSVVSEALSKQAATLLNCSPAYYSAPMLGYAAELAQAAGIGQVYFANSGAEANEAAVKLARKWGSIHKNGAYEIITTIGGFHGRSLAMMSASGKPGWDGLFEPKVPGFPKVPLNDPAAVETAVTDNTVGVMLEPIQGEAGVWPGTIEYFQALRDIADRHGLLLIFDEIQTGMGRTGSLFYFQQAGVLPDILTLGKGIGAGVPLAAVLADPDICCFEPGDQGGTYGGNALMAAVGSAVLTEISQPAFLAHVWDMSDYLTEAFEAISARHGLGEVRGAGLLLALSLGDRADSAAISEAALSAGLLLNAPRPDSLRFVPALNVTKQEIDTIIGILDRVLN